LFRDKYTTKKRLSSIICRAKYFTTIDKQRRTHTPNTDGRSIFSGRPALRTNDKASEDAAIVCKLHAITLITQKVRPFLLRLCRFAKSIRKEKYISVN
jgi:hypothetical protein